MNNLRNNKEKKVASINNSTNNDTPILSLVWELGWIITVPIVILAVGGAYLDKKMGTSPWMLLGGVVISIIITSVSIYYKMIKILGEINRKS